MYIRLFSLRLWVISMADWTLEQDNPVWEESSEKATVLMKEIYEVKLLSKCDLVSHPFHVSGRW